MVKVKTELIIRVNDQIDDHTIPPDYKQEYSFEDGCDCTIGQLLTWINHQKKLFDAYVAEVFSTKYAEHE